MELEKKELYLHSMMCVVGGFFGAYAVLSRAGTLASAQTLNMIEVVLALLGRDYIQFFLRVICVLLYMSAVMIALVLMKRTHVSVQRYSILVDVAGMVLLSVIPADVDIVIGIMPIFFMMSTQWTVFHGNAKYTSSTIFSTNNLKQMTLALGGYFLDKDESQLDKAKYFGNSILWYHIGVVISFFACHVFDIQASLCGLPLALVAIVLTYVPEKQEETEKSVAC
jgi:uncharacterized membrane protein YoaK (UPF0700 family)